MELRGDERGLAMGIVVFFAMLVVGALLYIIMDTAFVEIFAFGANQATSPGAIQQVQMSQTIWGGVPYVIVLIAMLFLLMRAVNEGGVR